jgi:hypothetical protein
MYVERKMTKVLNEDCEMVREFCRGSKCGGVEKGHSEKKGTEKGEQGIGDE